MILADSCSSNIPKDLSGVNLLFLAPEYFSADKFDFKVDVWSIGAILYLLITNGVKQINTKGSFEEHFNFMEPIWLAMDEFLGDFIKMMVVTDPDYRADIDTLFKSEFIRRHENRMLENNIISKTLTVDPEPMLLKFYTAYLINEIMLRHRKNIHKKTTLFFEWAFYIEKIKKAREEYMREASKAKREKTKDWKVKYTIEQVADYDECNSKEKEGELKVDIYLEHVRA